MGQWLVDGMNVVGSRPDGWWRDRAGARRRLVAELGDFARATGDRVAVVFDGREVASEVADGHAAGVSVAFAPGARDAADDAIVAAVASWAGDLPVVVTSDAGLVRRLEAVGAPVLGVSAFRRRLDGARTGGEGPPR